MHVHLTKLAGNIFQSLLGAPFCVIVGYHNFIILHVVSVD